MTIAELIAHLKEAEYELGPDTPVTLNADDGTECEISYIAPVDVGYPTERAMIERGETVTIDATEDDCF